ncbi:glycosyltransferase [Flavobacterium sp. WC2430]|uniref:glycosyltransferase n=1 Tax=Flavobacterium sp. WC2430 TaxID=3234137 RepID=UPI00346685C1
MNYPVQVSVLLSVYNEPVQWLKESIDSILTQTFQNFEFIIINDNPENSVNKIFLEEYTLKDDRILLINNSENIGLTKSLNKGLKIVKGKYIARMDADDIAFCNRFEIQVDYLNRNESISIVGSWTKTFGIENKEYKYLSNSKLLKASLFFGNRMSHSSVMFRKEDFIINNLYYDSVFSKSQDYELWCRASLKLNLANVNLVLMMNRTHSEQISNAGLNSQNEYADKVKLRWLDNLGLNFNEREKYIFLSFINNEILINDDFSILITLLKEILKANITEKIFDKQSFKVMLFYKIGTYSFKMKFDLILQLKMFSFFFTNIF